MVSTYKGHGIKLVLNRPETMHIKSYLPDEPMLRQLPAIGKYFQNPTTGNSINNHDMQQNPGYLGQQIASPRGSTRQNAAKFEPYTTKRIVPWSFGRESGTA
jgi:hypothetical protein